MHREINDNVQDIVSQGRVWPGNIPAITQEEAWEKLISKPKVMVICGTYLKTYTQDHNVSYSEAKGYPPTEIGAPTIEITPDNTWVKMSVVS